MLIEDVTIFDSSSGIGFQQRVCIPFAQGLRCDKKELDGHRCHRLLRASLKTTQVFFLATFTSLLDVCRSAEYVLGLLL